MVEVYSYLKYCQMEVGITRRLTEIGTKVNLVCLENPLYRAVPFSGDRGRKKTNPGAMLSDKSLCVYVFFSLRMHVFYISPWQTKAHQSNSCAILTCMVYLHLCPIKFYFIQFQRPLLPNCLKSVYICDMYWSNEDNSVSYSHFSVLFTTQGPQALHCQLMLGAGSP